MGFHPRASVTWKLPVSRTHARLVLPLPAGVAVCLCCGPLPLSGGTAVTASRHTRATAHPTVYAAEVQ